VKSRKTAEIGCALSRKGFKKSDRRHTFYVFFVGGKKTTVRTRLSHGQSEYGASLLAQIARQLHLKTNEFEHLVDCPLSGADYEGLLRDRGVLE